MNMKDFAHLEKRPSYFSFFLECCQMISLLDTESAGKVIHAIADYFIDGDEPEGLEKNELRVFNRIKADADKSCEAWLSRVKGGQEGAENRWGKKQGSSR